MTASSPFVSKSEETIASVIRQIRTELVATYVERIGHPEVARQIREHFAAVDGNKEPPK